MPMTESQKQVCQNAIRRLTAAQASMGDLSTTLVDGFPDMPHAVRQILTAMADVHGAMGYSERKLLNLLAEDADSPSVTDGSDTDDDHGKGDGKGGNDHGKGDGKGGNGHGKGDGKGGNDHNKGCGKGGHGWFTGGKPAVKGGKGYWKSCSSRPEGSRAFPYPSPGCPARTPVPTQTPNTPGGTMTPNTPRSGSLIGAFLSRHDNP